MALSRGAKIGIIVISVVILLILLGVILYFVLRNSPQNPSTPSLPLNPLKPIPLNPLQPIPLVPPPPAVVLPIEFLSTGQSMQQGTALADVSRRYQLTIQTDGNLVLYDTGVVPKKALYYCCAANWGTAPYQLQNRIDGNLVVVDSTGKLGSTTGTAGKTSNSRLIVTTAPSVILVDVPTGNIVWQAS